ncbi:hypothetical protein G5714_024662 [Onychostoma macrolepis]|uniref:Uncharacterized protein n=1 Tax=Onychostoma macrolepis TaxID=369639 RepID=A0A7J6BJV9_9TELE|nr:hypothetical protein G5714_024662 [Onychostoma macrolepis]
MLWQILHLVDYEDLQRAHRRLDSVSGPATLVELLLRLFRATDLIRLVFDRLGQRQRFQDVGSVLVSSHPDAAGFGHQSGGEDIMMNRVFAVVSPHFEDLTATTGFPGSLSN